MDTLGFALASVSPHTTDHTLSESLNATTDSTTATSSISTTNSMSTTSSDGTASESPGSHNKSGSGAPAGTVAGAAVGCLAGGLILGALAAFFLLGRRGKRNKHYRQQGQIASKELDHSPPDPDPPSNDVKLNRFLLDTIPNKELMSELRALGDLVNMHVENNYQFQPVSINSSAMTQSILDLGFPPASGDVAAALCLNPRTRVVGLRHVISHIAFASIDFNAPTPLSMLPVPMASFLQSLPSVEPQSSNSPETCLALSRWRVLSAFLLHPTRGERTPLAPSEETAVSQAQRLASALNTVLYHFVSSDPGKRQAQTEHLEGVMMEFAKFGHILLSQPSDWRLIYDTSTAGVGQRSVIVCAGLEKMSHRDGRPYGSPQLVEAPRVIQVA
ncbi:uncharacterized protein FTOL_10585 [Fusarium torulosum]|uniref:Uncharacterized protein n=1 Tax=Fusarium torulosum TaxID=33205 RepID=A0AAE8SM22_9HYPO|nr:uncharacterized protein FTOL_10585 [Fusarium torulosum]